MHPHYVPYPSRPLTARAHRGLVLPAVKRALCGGLGPGVAPTTARAEDGVYGRFEGDLVVTAGLGGGVAPARPWAGIMAAEVEALYLDSAGLIATTERVGQTLGFTLGVKLRPLFLARFFSNVWTGNSFVDLLMDSLGLELGTWLGPVTQGAGSALWLGTGIEVPLGIRRQGLHLRLSARYVHTRADDLAAPDTASTGMRFLITLVYAGVLDSGVASRERPRPPH
jgi:hypothetical protein